MGHPPSLITIIEKIPLLQATGSNGLRPNLPTHDSEALWEKLREISGINREGVSLLGISEAAEKVGFRTMGGKLTIEQLSELELPAILHWNQSHFVVLYKIKRGSYFIADPGNGLIEFTLAELKPRWLSSEDFGIALILSPTPALHAQEGDKTEALNWSYLYRYKQLVIQLFVGLGVGSLLQLIIPFLTQSIVDIGINTRNLNFIYIILIAQTMLFLGRMSVDFIRAWILLHISTRINISILTDFLIKLKRPYVIVLALLQVLVQLEQNIVRQKLKKTAKIIQ